VPRFAPFNVLRFAALAALAAAVLFLSPRPAVGVGVFTVNSTTDPGGDGLCNLAECTLREAINAANAQPNEFVPDLIEFAIPQPGSLTIQPTSALPVITDPVIIDGTTQPGCASYPCIELRGDSAGPVNGGLKLDAGNSTVRGLVVNRFDGDGIDMGEAGDNYILGNFIGTGVTGTLDRGTRSQAFVYEVTGNVIGGRLIGPQRDLGKRHRWRRALRHGAMLNIVSGNYIGTNKTGTADLGNDADGVRIFHGPFNTIGGISAGERNVISGNGERGVDIVGDGAMGNAVQGNYIGTNAAGTAGLGNSMAGVTIYEAPGNLVGGLGPTASNVISGNAGDGVLITGGGAADNLLQRNFIGTDSSGREDIGNAGSGVLALNSGPTVIGSLDPTAGNRIAYNGGDGVTVLITVSPSILKGIHSNSIFENDGLGIDLGDDGGLERPGDGDLGERAPELPGRHQRGERRGDTFADVASTAPRTHRSASSSSPTACDPSGLARQELIGWTQRRRTALATPAPTFHSEASPCPAATSSLRRQLTLMETPPSSRSACRLRDRLRLPPHPRPRRLQQQPPHLRLHPRLRSPQRQHPHPHRHRPGESWGM
jgi:CSLREA domain-containing protein